MNEWTNGVVVDQVDIKSGILFFLNTPQGIAVMYPRVHEKRGGVGLGSYLRVITAPSRSHPTVSQNDEVQCFEWNEQPEDHEVDVQWSKVSIKCNAVFVGQEKGWYIFENKYLGLLGMKETGGLYEKSVRVGCLYRVVVRRVKEKEDVSSIRESIVWSIEDIDFAERSVNIGRWFEGVVTRSVDQYLLITSPDISSDAVLYDWKKKIHTMPESMLGQWIRFQVENRKSADSGLRYRVMDTFTDIDSLYRTRVKSGLVEVQIVCRWTGEMEDTRALLQSEIGPIRDYDAIIDTRNKESKGEYHFWVVKHFRQNHTARWKLSIYDSEPVKIKEEPMVKPREERLEEKPVNESSLSRVPSSKSEKDGRVIDMMNRLMKVHLVRDTLMEKDKVAAMRIEEILDRHTRTK